MKNNVKALKEWAMLAFSDPVRNGMVAVEDRSGEVWERRTDVLTNPPEAMIPEVISQALPGVKTLIRREHRITRWDGCQTTEVREAVSSLLTARETEAIWRGHWGHRKPQPPSPRHRVARGSLPVASRCSGIKRSCMAWL
ncbi:MAG: hypothetical protein AB1511_03805 [Deinococcota bacterium]